MKLRKFDQYKCVERKGEKTPKKARQQKMKQKTQNKMAGESPNTEMITINENV